MRNDLVQGSTGCEGAAQAASEVTDEHDLGGLVSSEDRNGDGIAESLVTDIRLVADVTGKYAGAALGCNGL